jgi:pyruvate/2-oxoglutarate dehydrogenase complex dihydrolipoamide dehydrogenase (E3) component
MSLLLLLLRLLLVVVSAAVCSSGVVNAMATAKVSQTLLSKSLSKSLSFDVVIVGGGSAGLTAAKFASGTMGKSSLIVEQAKLGGDCTWTGCVPSKSLLASAKAAQFIRKHAIQQQQQQQQQTPDNNSNNWASIQTRYRQIQQTIYEEDDSPEAMAKSNVETMTGQACLTSPTTLQVTTTSSDDNTTTTTVIEAKEGIILCTGAVPRTPTNILGIQTVDYVTYEQVWDMKELPKRLTVIGGGPIGCELAQAFCRLGSKVTMIANRLLPREEPEVSDILQEVFEAEGIVVVSGRVAEVAKNGDGSHTATSSNGESVTGDVLLVSVGRTPNVKGLGIETVDIETNERGGIAVNDQLETSCQGIYAAGDCTGDQQL